MYLKTLLRKVASLFAVDTPEVIVKSKNEINISSNKYKIIVPDDLLWAFKDGEYYERNVIYFLDRIVRSYVKPIMIDVGANCGYYSIRYSDVCKKIFAFEPVASTYKTLEANIYRNSIINIKTLNYGLSEAAGELLINLYNSSANNSIFERNIPKEHSLKKIGTELIKLNSLDNLIAAKEVEIPDIIKIDVEGAELNVLKGAQKTISQYRPTILFEYSTSTALDAGYSKEILLDVLNLTNYKVYGIPEDENDCNLIFERNFDKASLANLIFVPEELDLQFNGNS